MLSGGSVASWSVTRVADTVTVQVSSSTKSESGSSVKVVPSPLALAVCAPLVEHEMVNQPLAVLTASENVMLMFEPTATPLASASGDVTVTDGALSLQLCGGVAELRADGVATLKSAALLSVSWQPLLARKSLVIPEIVGAGPEPSKKLAPLAPVPYPTRSTIRANAAAEQGAEPPLQPRPVAPVTSATLPAPAAMAIGVASVTSAVGIGSPTAAFDAS